MKLYLGKGILKIKIAKWIFFTFILGIIFMDVNVSKPITTITEITEDSSTFQPNKKLGILLSFVCLFLLGILPIISNSRPFSFSAVDFTFFLSFWQVIFAVPLFFFSILKPEDGIFDKTIPTPLKKQTLKIIPVVSVLFLFSTFLYVLTFEKAGTINAAIAVQSFPVFTILLETIFLSKKKNLQELTFTFVLILALIYLGTGGTFLLKNISFWFLLALGVPIIWSVAHLTVKSFMEKSAIKPEQIIFFRVTIIATLLFVTLLIVDGPDLLLNEFLNPALQIYAVVMGLVYYVELYNWYYAIKNIDVSIAGSITTPTPVITMVFAILFLKEILLTYQLVALLLVCASLYGILYVDRKKELNKRKN